MPHCPDIIPMMGSLSSDTDTDEPEDTSPPPEEENACHGVSGDYWIMSREVAVENVKDFCSQTEDIKTYNVGSVNELELSVEFNSEPGSPTDAPDCVGRFQNAVIDGCDGNDPINNPNNYKFGSTLTTTDGWQYKMVPLSKQVNEVNCDVSYKFFYDAFEIRGKNWPSAKLGINGQGLRDELLGCGALTKWKFELTPDDCCFQWYATGQLPIGTKACVGRAVESAGGSNKDNCHGVGKRRERASIEDWPGYGDDSKHVFRDEEPT